MSQALTTTEPVSAQALEHVLGTGDLSKLTTQQRVEYLVATCKSLGLNPLTRPIRFLSLNGQIQIYFTRDGTDQLRSSRSITLHVVDKSIDAGVFSVTVRARTKDGREDEDIGAVVLPASGDSRANALMKAITKAKRRVTLSICGLGQTDESELDTMPGARVFDAEDDVPVAPIRTARDVINDSIPLRSAAAATPRAERKVDSEVYDAEPAAAYPGAPPNEKPERTEAAWRIFLDKLRAAVAVLHHRSEVVEIGGRATVGDALAAGPEWVQREISSILAEAYARFPAEPGDDLDEVEIAGEEKVGAGD
jgi:hypothetical protein